MPDPALATSAATTSYLVTGLTGNNSRRTLEACTFRESAFEPSPVCTAPRSCLKPKITGDHASFIVRKKTFSYFLNNHHGDGIVAVCFKMAPGDNAKLVALDPSRFYLPAYIGPKGWTGLRLDVGKIEWDEVADFVGDSYRLVAPRRLVELTSSRPSEPRRK
jgi:YjbR